MADDGNLENVCRDCMVDRAKQSMESSATSHKICVRIPEDSGWKIAAEWFWAEKHEDGTYELCNIPFYAYGLSMHDLVHVRTREDGILEFADVARRGGHSTYRVIANESLDSPNVKSRLDDVRALGCEVEPANRIHAAIDVAPDADIHKVYSLLEKAEQDGIWGFEEGHCGHALRSRKEL